MNRLKADIDSPSGESSLTTRVVRSPIGLATPGLSGSDNSEKEIYYAVST